MPHQDKYKMLLRGTELLGIDVDPEIPHLLEKYRENGDEHFYNQLSGRIIAEAVKTGISEDDARRILGL